MLLLSWATATYGLLKDAYDTAGIPHFGGDRVSVWGINRRSCWERPHVLAACSEEVVMVTHNVAEEKRQATAVQESDGWFRVAFENASIGMALTSESGQFISTNRAFCEMLGYPAGELDGTYFRDITHPEDQADSEHRLRRLVSGEVEVAYWEKRYLHADGHTVWARLSVTPVRDPEGGLLCFVAQMEDITAYREAEAALAASEERFRQAFETAAAGMALVSVENGQFLRVNQAGCEMLGYSEKELLDLTIQDVTDPDDREESFTRFHRVITGEVPSSRAKLRYLRRDGSTAYGIVSTALVRDSDGRPLHMVVNVVDITEQVEAEKRLTDLLASKDEFIASVSHELRTPLSAVLGFAELLRDEMASLSPAERMEMIQSIAEQSVDLTNIVEDLLVAARVDTDALTVVRVPVDLRAQTAQVLEALDSGTEVAHIEVSGRTVRALGDPARVRQILRNLISNALRWGGERIQVTIDSRDSSARLAVADNGPGVPPDQRDRIFEPYHRSHHKKGLTASIGLGLAVSRQLARLMDGDLTYSYHQGQSIFELALPQAPTKATPFTREDRTQQDILGSDPPRWSPGVLGS